MPELTSLATRLKTLIGAAHSQKEVARLAGVSDGTLINWLRGLGVRASKLRQVARNLGVSLEWLRDGVGDAAAELAAFHEKLHPVPNGPWLLVRAERERAGLSLEQFAERTGFDLLYHTRLERGLILVTRQAVATFCRVLPALPKEELMDHWPSSLVTDTEKEKKPWGVGPDDTKGYYVPLIPFTQAGELDIMKTDVDDGYHMIFVVNFTDHHGFAVKVSGNSMEPVLREGDLVVCSPALKINNGEAAIVRTHSAQVFIKYWHKRGARVLLESANSDYKPIDFPLAEIAGAWPIVQTIATGKVSKQL